MTTESEEQTLQELKENFSIGQNVEFKHRTTGDMTDVFHLIQKGQQHITVAAQDREEANDSEKVNKANMNK
jgi:hypothetical protein